VNKKEAKKTLIFYVTGTVAQAREAERTFFGSFF
jgi:hypothetical protein